MNGTKLAEVIEAEASNTLYKNDVDGYAMEMVGNAINIPDGLEIAFTSDGYIIEGKDREQQERDLLAANSEDAEGYDNAETFINDAVWAYIDKRPVFFAE